MTLQALPFWAAFRAPVAILGLHRKVCPVFLILFSSRNRVFLRPQPTNSKMAVAGILAELTAKILRARILSRVKAQKSEAKKSKDFKKPCQD